MLKLLHCPFCGSNPEIMFDDMSDYSGSWIRCSACGIEQMGYYSEYEAIHKWNTRIRKN